MFNPAAFVLEALLNKTKENATWGDVYFEFTVLSEVDRVGMLEAIKSSPKSMSEHLTQFLVSNLENPSHAEEMFLAINDGLIDLSILWTSPDGEEVGSDNIALA